MKRIYQDILNRSYNALFHPSVQWHRVLKEGYRVPRYPSPASEPVDHQEHDFKTPYRDSMYHVRNSEYERPIVENFFVADPISETVPQKLVRLNLLSQKDINNQELVEQARTAYILKYSEQPETKVYCNQTEDAHFSEIVSNNRTRESIAHLIREQFEDLKERRPEDVIQTNLDDDYKPSMNLKEDFNLNGNDPMFRQLIVDLHTVLGKFGERNQQQGYQEFFKGDPNYWHQLDNSFEPNQIREVQSALGDTSLLDPKTLAKVHNTNDYHVEVKQQLPFENEYYK